MSKPNLFRSGNTTPPRFDNVRVRTDIIVVDGSVGPNSGGVSAFSRKGSSWPTDETWVIEGSTPLGDGLQVIDGCGTHWLIAPSQEMTLETYKAHLASLNSKAVQYDKSAFSEADSQVRRFKTLPEHNDRAIRFIYIALASVVQARIPVAGWDENDYEYVATLAEALEDGTVPLSAVVWDPAASDASGGCQWSRERAVTAHALSVFIAHEYARAEASGDEDVQADVANDNGFLRAVMGFGDARNPFAAVYASVVA